MVAAAPEAVRLPGVYTVDGEDDWIVIPQTYGPTWDRDPTWDGPRDPEGYILPKITLGWQVIKWIETNLLADETDENDQPLPFKLTNEQMRFLLWFYAIDETGRFHYREVVLQRLKGWGKDPLAACIAAVEFVGPCRFAGWVTEDRPELDLVAGDPYAKPHPRAWIQIAAVSLVQTQNTMKLFQGLFSDACKAEHGIDIGKETIYAYKGKKTIQAVTSSPRALEGNRPTLVIKNETHHWIKSNDGLAMSDAIERNATKAKGGAARSLSITNAYEPSEDSVAKQEREAWEAGEAGRAMKTDMMYDSLEAPKKAALRPWKKPPEGMEPEDVETLTRRYLSRILESVRGGAWWLDIPSLVSSILSPKNKPSRSRRFWFNQVVASEDSWLDPAAVEAAISQIVRENRMITGRSSKEILHAGWDVVHTSEPIVLTFDGSKSDDSTALIGTRLSDGFQFVVGVWQKPPKARNGSDDDSWLVPREDVDARVTEAFKRFNIVAFWGDPSHTKDDEDSSSFWDGMLDRWMRRYKDRLDKTFWPVKSGPRIHAVLWDMSSSANQQTFVSAAEQYAESMERLNDIEEYAPEFQIDGHPALVDHLLNARRYLHPQGFGVSLMKENRESAKKIDLAVCAVMGQMLRRIVLNSGLEEEEKPGEVWGVGF